MSEDDELEGTPADPQEDLPEFDAVDPLKREPGPGIDPVVPPIPPE